MTERLPLRNNTNNSDRDKPYRWLRQVIQSGVTKAFWDQ